mmetsp:Transcript_12793/g.14439  ORF Transcript_12793/g.14439 Transcript_12793/m.14439 type:complete len:139 (+) Transcript_12793:1700-2116(+)
MLARVSLDTEVVSLSIGRESKMEVTRFSLGVGSTSSDSTSIISSTLESEGKSSAISDMNTVEKGLVMHLVNDNGLWTEKASTQKRLLAVKAARSNDKEDLEQIIVNYHLNPLSSTTIVRSIDDQTISTLDNFTFCCLL